MTLANRLPFFYGWVVVGIAFVTMGVGVNSRTAFSLLFPPILDEFGWERATVAATFSIGFMVSALLSPLIGALMDRYGPRIVIPMGAVLTAAGLAAATFSSQPWHFYVTLGAMVVGGSIFMAYIGHGLFVPSWFERRRGLAIGVAYSGVGVGSIFGFPWVQHIIATEGWRVSAWILAGFILAIVVPLNVLFQRHRPDDLGLRPDGDQPGDPLNQPAGASRRSRAEDRIVDHDWAATEWTLGRAIRTGRFWWLMLCFVSALYAWYAVQVHQTRFLLDVGISDTAAALALGLVGLTGIVGQIAIGHLSDRVGREWAWTISLSGFAVSYVLLLVMRVAPSEPLAYAMAATQGLLGYGMASVYGAVPVELFAGRRYGLIFGAIGGVSGTGAAIGPWVTGLMFDHFQVYEQAFAVAIGFCAISIFAMWMAAPRKVRVVAGRIPKSRIPKN